MNYKIRITADNQAIVKRIADENNMNNSEEYHYYIGYYLITDGDKIRNFAQQANFPELTTEQFIELFDKKETELDKWLKETKAKNLSLEELINYIEEDTTSDSVYSLLQGNFAKQKAQILFNQWNNPTEESPKVETEWQPKRGDRVLVWDDVENAAEEKIFILKSEGEAYPNRVVASGSLRLFFEGHPFESCGYKNMKPLPIEQPKETDFKTKVIELIEKRIEKRTQDLEHAVANKAYMTASTIEVVITIQKDLLNQIKQL